MIEANSSKKKIKPVRTLSGVAPMAVMMKPFTCPGQCIYCPLEVGMPRSYLSDEPAAQRAKRLAFDPYRQVKMRLRQLRATGHETSKIELIVIGGTFSAYPDVYKKEFFKGMYEAVNGKRSRTLAAALKANETARRRVVGVSVETRPDWVTEKEVKLIRSLGVTKVQLGVQALDRKIARLTKRGHGEEEVVRATRLLRNAGLKICYHLMPGLPGSNPKKDILMNRKIYSDKRFRPDYVKIYPCVVVPYTPLKLMWERGEFKPYDDETLKQVLKEMCAVTPPWVRIDRLVRDISRKWVVAGTNKTNLRQEVEKELADEGRACRCVRCREVRGASYAGESRLAGRTIETLGGKEIFISYERGDKLYALLRLRLPDQREKLLFRELKGAALVREVHTFGEAVALSRREAGRAQHQGLGRKLMERAEAIAAKTGYRKMAVISAIGTREYYRKLGYHLEGSYMVKVFPS